MGAVWCKVDKAENRCFCLKTNSINKWTHQVCQVYKRPKDVYRPPRSNSRVGDRSSISHPHPLSVEINHKGWQSPALVVPDYTPVPPPRMKRKNKLQELRNSKSMSCLNRQEKLEHSTISLPEMINSYEMSRSSSTFVVKPDIENNDYEVLRKCDSDLVPDKPARRDFQSHQIYNEIPLNNHHKSGMDKLSDISEELTYYDELQSKTADGSSMNILKHIYNISSVSKLPRGREDVNEESKTAWLQNTLTADDLTLNTDRNDRLHVVNGETDSTTPPPTPTKEQPIIVDNAAAHSVLLEILKKHSKKKNEVRVLEKEEPSIGTDIKTNSIIYKSSSTDKLSDKCFINSFPKTKSFKTSSNTSSTSTPPLLRRHTYHSDLYNLSQEQNKEESLTDYECKTLSLGNTRSNPYIVDKDYKGSTNRSYVSALRDLDCIQTKQIEVSSEKLKYLSQNSNDSGLVIKPTAEDIQHVPSRKSSITDSLQEFEISIYDMLKESKKQNDSSDDEEKPKVKT